MSQMKRLLGVLAMAAGVLGILDAGTSHAQAPAAVGDLQSRYDAAFQEMLRQPSDLEVLFKFAKLAAETGDLEGAISALDRLLLIDGDQPDVKLELGVLYFRLGSFEAARNYLEEARTSTHASAAVKERAAAFIKEIKRP